jgi:hypothetical protein
MAIIGVARQAVRRQDEGYPQSRHDTDLDAKLVGLVRFALADALDLEVNLPAMGRAFKDRHNGDRPQGR